MEYKDLLFNNSYLAENGEGKLLLRFQNFEDIWRFIKYHNNVLLENNSELNHLVLYGSCMSQEDFDRYLENHCTCKDFSWDEIQCPYALEFANNRDEVEYCMCCEFCASNCANDI